MEQSTSGQRARYEEQLSARTMRLLSGGLTEEGDTFLIAVAAILLTGILYPLIGGWSFLVLPIVFIAAALGRKHLRRRRGAG
jgi:hypothetical protein